ncbi:hematopoietic cell signal transducer [Acanthochromis polyacanthus]|uniref:hematopoietic cell signal transducer n=1 Tax=Acanthochromis polyacanthus TaxID=80966 RepID=UPI002234036D|nr:hematopoietic cell signal transducer [Acanthochromis polyacanthus]
MAFNKFFIVAVCCLCYLTVALADSTVSCYRIEPGTIAGIICADVLLTLIIVAATYRCASFRRQKIDNANKVYMNVRDYCKS